MSFKVRELNSAGIQAFSSLLDTMSLDPDKAAWNPGSYLKDQIEKILQSKEYTNIVAGDIQIDPAKTFQNRFEFGQYLFGLFGQRHIEKDAGLLSWIALLYFNQICEDKKQSGRLKILSKYRYIPEVDNARRFYRHLVLTPLLLCQRLQENAVFLLSNPLYESSDAVEQLVSRKEFISNPKMPSVARQLYFDEKKQKPRSGAFSKSKPGNAIRLAQDIIPQLSMNFDMYTASKDKIIELLPEDFEGWKAEKKA
jgi:hypothetical protein